MVFVKSPDRPAEPTAASITARRRREMAVGVPLDLRIHWASQERYQCPLCAVYIKVGAAAVGETRSCSRCQSLYRVHTIEEGSVTSFVPVSLHGTL